MEMPSRVSKVTAFKIQSKITWLKQKKKKKKNGKKPQKYIKKQIIPLKDLNRFCLK